MFYDKLDSVNQTLVICGSLSAKDSLKKAHFYVFFFLQEGSRRVIYKVCIVPYLIYCIL